MNRAGTVSPNPCADRDGLTCVYMYFGNEHVR